MDDEIQPAQGETGSREKNLLSFAHLLQLCVERGKVEELLDAMAAEHPGAFI